MGNHRFAIAGWVTPNARPSSGASAWTQRGRILTVGGMVLAAAVAGFAIGAAVNGGTAAGADVPRFRSLDPMPGEFRLGPGLAQPPGITVHIPSALRPVPGEFRLGPGLAQPPGIMVQLPSTARPVPGEFRLGPGLAQPPGIVVPLS